MPSLTEAEVDVLAARPREEMNDAERAYVEALEHLNAGRRPDDLNDAAKWEARRLVITPSVVARQSGCRREPIAGEASVYGWIWRLIRREAGRIVEPVAGVGDLGPRGLAASNVALRSIQAGLLARLEAASEKGRLYDELVSGQVALTTRPRAGRAGSSNRSRSRWTPRKSPRSTDLPHEGEPDVQ